MVEFHAAMFSIKNPETLVGNAHWNAKKLMNQSLISHRLINNIKDAVEKLIDKNTKLEEKEKLKGVLTNLLKEFENVSISEEKVEFLVVREAAEVQKVMLTEMRKHSRGKIHQLLKSHSMPRSIAADVLKKVRKETNKVKDDIQKQAQISLEVERDSSSATLQTLKFRAPSGRAAARIEKKKAYKIEHIFSTIRRTQNRLEEDERKHDMGEIGEDIVELVRADGDVIHSLYVDLLYCSLFMSYMEKNFKKLGKIIRKGRRHLEKGFMLKLENELERIKQEWNMYMNKITTALQQLRFSVAPAQEAKVLSGVGV